MRNRVLPLAGLLLFAAVGCKPKLEDQVVGTWSGPNNSSVTINQDKTWTSDIPAGPVTLKTKGDWVVNGDAVTLTPKTVNDRPVAEVVKQIQDVAKRMGQNAGPLADLAKPDDFTVSSDGKTLTLKNPKNGPMTLTKK